MDRRRGRERRIRECEHRLCVVERVVGVEVVVYGAWVVEERLEGMMERMAYEGACEVKKTR